MAGKGQIGKKAEEKIKEWRPVVDDPMYEVSSDGEVRSIDRYVKGKGNSTQFRKGRLLKIHKFESGYCYVVIRNKNRLLHRLVASAFIPNVDHLPCVNHINGDKSKNDVSNLEWCSYQENTRHAILNDLMKISDESHMCKMTEHSSVKNCKPVRCIETKNEFSSIKECAKSMNIRLGYLYEYFSGAAKSCHGYHFELIREVI